MKTLVSYVYFETQQSLYNLEFFLYEGSKIASEVDIFLVINGKKCSLSIPGNINVIMRENIGFDFGGHKAVLDSVNIFSYDYFIFLNSSVIGPFLPNYYNGNWTYTFTNMLNDKVKLAGTSIVCLPSTDLGGFGPKVEGYAWCTDKIGLKVLLDKGTIFIDHKTKKDTIVNGEYAVSNTIINAGYNLDCLLYKYKGIDWLNKDNWNMNNNQHPSRKDTYDGISIHPFETVFHKWYWSDHPNSLISFDFVDKYKNWRMKGMNLNKVDFIQRKVDINDGYFYGSFTPNPKFNKITSVLRDEVIKTTNFNTIFGDPEVGVVKYLQLNIDGDKYLIKENSEADNIKIVPCNYNEDFKIKIVYYAYLNTDVNWKAIVFGQLNDLVKSGLLDRSQLYICLCYIDFELDIDEVKKEILAIVPGTKFTITNKNLFEYPGIKLVWDLSRELSRESDDKDLILYFHSKGMSRSSNSRTVDERQIFQTVILSWKQVLEIFTEYKHINKVGVCASEEGWQWFNFWWCRGSYLKICSEPIITSDRWYYESWLGRFGSKTNKDCWSLVNNSDKHFGDPTTACSDINSVTLLPSEFISQLERFYL